MGFFKSDRNQTRTIRTMRTERTDSNSDLHYKAKSKLIGAVVLALLGVLILPFIFSNDEPINQPAMTEQAPLVSPSNQPSGGAEGNIAISAAPGVLPSEQVTPAETTPATQSTVPATQTPSAVASAGGTNDTTGTTVPQSIASSVGNNAVTATEVTSTTAEGGQALTITDTTQVQAAADEAKRKADEAKRKTEEATKQANNTKSTKSNHTIRDENRTDDGSVALALLEGKEPSSTKNSPASTASKTPSKSGKYSVQLAAYTSMDDARAQRDRLSSSGVSNAFVQTAMVNGRQTYRLRVGPFTSQEAAQAALTRLRGLGHSGFITGN